MKERLLAIFLLFLALLTIWALFTELPEDTSISTNTAHSSDAVTTSAPVTASSPLVSDEVIRLHILADSDTNTDQAIKLAVRDALLPYLNAATMTAATKEEALSLLQEQCPVFEEIANAALERLGADYTATITLESLYFPIRIYGSQTYLSGDAVIFPPGFYDSVQVILGEGNGHNWWCLAYPSLCFVDAVYDYIPKDSPLYKQKIATVEKSVLDELFYGSTGKEMLFTAGSFSEYNYEEVDNPIDEDEITIYFGSKLWELLKELLS